jgi:EAL domain-containing protein (putative c-di-GMP-specific phosphodiesterase class I)
MNASAFERMTLETDLRDAIERRELLVYYQPKVEISSGTVVGMEALLRWQHPELGMVSPAQFIPIAEETGLIIPIGEYVLREACAQSKRWQEQGLRPIRMAVNLSTVQFRDPDLLKMVTRVLRTTGLAPDHLELELTESVLLQRADSTVATLQSLKRMGVHLAIDDFGTGYSSLSYLKRFPIDSLKIDQSFIREVTTNPEDVAITTSIILMGRSLKLRVVAEGVESPSQLALLKVLECDEAQGYLFSRPAPASDMEKLLAPSFAFTPAA